RQSARRVPSCRSLTDQPLSEMACSSLCDQSMSRVGSRWRCGCRTGGVYPPRFEGETKREVKDHEDRRGHEIPGASGAKPSTLAEDRLRAVCMRAHSYLLVS